jgi:branched-chain amino acid transport system ATP-binding protein
MATSAALVGSSAVTAAALDSIPDARKTGVLLRAAGLHKSFGGVHAVQDISLAIPEGAVSAIIGPNGAGKSTLLNLLSGIYRPDAGSIVLDGIDLTGLPAHRRVRHGIARTFQKIRLFKRLSVIDNVVAGFHLRNDIPAWQYVVHGRAFRRNHARSRDEAARLLAFMRLEHRAHVPAGSLSYGEQRMLEIARALATAPRLLMVDEPAAGLNAAEVEMLLHRLQTLRDRGITLCLIEHNMDLVMKVADRVMVIDHGEYLFEGAPAEVQAHAGVIAAYLGGPPP